MKSEMKKKRKKSLKLKKQMQLQKLYETWSCGFEISTVMRTALRRKSAKLSVSWLFLYFFPHCPNIRPFYCAHVISSSADHLLIAIFNLEYDRDKEDTQDTLLPGGITSLVQLTLWPKRHDDFPDFFLNRKLQFFYYTKIANKSKFRVQIFNILTELLISNKKPKKLKTQ